MKTAVGGGGIPLQESDQFITTVIQAQWPQSWPKMASCRRRQADDGDDQWQGLLRHARQPHAIRPDRLPPLRRKKTRVK